MASLETFMEVLRSGAAFSTLDYRSFKDGDRVVDEALYYFLAHDTPAKRLREFLESLMEQKIVVTLKYLKGAMKDFRANGKMDLVEELAEYKGFAKHAEEHNVQVAAAAVVKNNKRKAEQVAEQAEDKAPKPVKISKSEMQQAAGGGAIPAPPPPPTGNSPAKKSVSKGNKQKAAYMKSKGGK
jgi:hypothetical protein